MEIIKVLTTLFFVIMGIYIYMYYKKNVLGMTALKSNNTARSEIASGTTIKK